MPGFLKQTVKMALISMFPTYAARVSERYWKNAELTHERPTPELFDKIGTSVHALVNPQPGEKILDYGCGSGEIGIYFQKKGADITGCDISAKLLRKAQALGLPAQDCDDLYRQTGAGFFDKIYMNGVMMYIHPSNRTAFLKKMHSWLKENGGLYICDEPDFERRHLIKYNFFYKLLLFLFPVYSLRTGGFFTKFKSLEKKGRHAGFREIRRVDSWTSYRCHYILTK